MSDEKPFFISQNTGFSTISEKDELLHPERNALVKDVSASETQYFGFSIPGECIHALCYLWHRPHLRLITGGLLAWQGIKPAAQFSELFDWRAYMNDDALANDLHEYRLDNGYGIKILEPLNRLHMTYEDAPRKNSVDLIFEGVAPPVMFGDGNHFEQAMRATGKLVLRGKEYKVNCYNVRDRSWGKPRQDMNMHLPPMTWMTGVFNDDYSFNCCVMDQAEGNPEIAGSSFDMPQDKTLSGGWIHRDGKVGRIVRAKKRIRRDPKTLSPMVVDVEAFDEFDRRMELHGTLIATNGVFAIWPHAYQHHPLMRWESEGMVTHGDCQEGIWNDYLNFIQAK